ncbi:hypothetical protein BU26DRAFT_414758 [Trematosphaeria pertusa]|uniref:Stress-response A/B barrel domain-containing protein n=1 Tax=Trematosphaeria pertusa TaxID=390896 RepID=A0A6A6J4H3_9PLEO|nr:uncharacterized protein BU26DRAFT_414758 [Trematosphaeria pertusa]KAF2256383.1 hypothetical protein BU26DRAFT_414758 [Trematosphaeria pertusa]
MRSKTNPVTSLLDVVLQRKPQDVIPPTTHIVLFQFKQSVTPFQVKEITSKMLALKKSCIHPSTRTSYIKSITGGKDNSIEDLQDGISHAFIVQFYTNEDRTYYVDEDPVHQAFKDAVSPYLEKTQVVDFQEGVFTHAD